MSEPLYRSVYKDILSRIATGAYPPGAMLPSEFELGDEFDVSQGTARKALTELERKGVVERRQGRGTFVTLRTPESSLFHFFRLRDADGNQIPPELDRNSVFRRPARPEETHALFDHPAEVYEIARVRSFQGRAICHETVVVSAAMFPGLQDRAPLPNTLYVLFQRSYSCIIVTAKENLRADVLDEKLATDLGYEPGKPSLIVERRGFDLLDRCVELRESVVITDNLSYSITLS